MELESIKQIKIQNPENVHFIQTQITIQHITYYYIYTVI